MEADYRSLYVDVVEPLVRALDQSRPFLLSSPSNGVETERQGGLADNPGDPAFGDVHFYSEMVNLWRPQNFLTPRCATEFGVQSLPLKGTMLRWIKPSEWWYGSRSMTLRQHHPGGVLTLLVLVFEHFEIPSEKFNCTVTGPMGLLGCGAAMRSEAFIDSFSFLSQIHQALALQAQVEHYRRWRSRLNADDLGNTMCALYWQVNFLQIIYYVRDQFWLNDVWAAPTWSSIDFDLRWKIAHYFMRRSFAPVIVSMFLDDSEELRLFLVSDKASTLANCTLKFEMFLLRGPLEPIYSTQVPVEDIPALSSVEVEISTMIKNRINDDVVRYMFRAQLFASPDSGAHPVQISPRATLLPDKIYGPFGTVELTDFQRINSTSNYRLAVEASALVPVVWLDLSDEFKLREPDILFHFNDNGFALTEQIAEEIILLVFSNPKKVEIKKEDVLLRLL